MRGGGGAGERLGGVPEAVGVPQAAEGLDPLRAETSPAPGGTLLAELGVVAVLAVGLPVLL